MDLTFTNDPPAATLIASQPTAEVGRWVDLPRYAIHFRWQSNVAPCQLTYDGPGENDGSVTSQDAAAGDLPSYQFVPGTYVYRITCSNGNDVATATTTVDYLPPGPRVDVYIDDSIRPARDERFTIYWDTNQSPCVASGGNPGDGWAGPQTTSYGTPVVSAPTAGTHVYTMTCGTGADTVTSSDTLVIPPSAIAFEAHETETLMGRRVELKWQGTVGNCIPIGDWTSSLMPMRSSGSEYVYSDTPGMRTYTIRCGLSDFVEATTHVNYLPLPTVDLSASAVTATVNQPITLSWTSANAESCVVDGAGTAEWSGALPTSGSRVVTRSVPGSTSFYINCDGVADAVVVEWRSVISSPVTSAPPTVNLTIDHPTRISGEAVTLTWTTTRAAGCMGSGGANGDGWAGVLPVSGTETITVTGTGTFNWDITCDGAPPSATARVTAVYSAAASSGGGPSGGAANGGGSGGGGRLDPLLLAALGLMVFSAMTRAGRRRCMLAVDRN
jgi:hypothetical protein